MTAPAAPPASQIPLPDRTSPATFPLPAEVVAALELGRPVLFRDPTSGATLPLLDLARADRELALTPEEIREANAACDGGEELSETESLRRAIAENEADDSPPLTWEEMNEAMEAEFPALRAVRHLRKAGRE